jgi:hypothetical protein
LYSKDHVFPDTKGFVPASALTVAGGSSIGVKLFVPDRGVITRLIVSQLTGAFEGFSYTLYNSKAALSATGDNPTLAATETLYRLAGPVAVAANKKLYDGGGVWPNDGVHLIYLPYRNNDGNATIQDPSLYLHIAAAGTGAKTFGVAITISEPQYNR